LADEKRGARIVSRPPRELARNDNLAFRVDDVKLEGVLRQIERALCARR
jgi:hypothetical protein